MPSLNTITIEWDDEDRPLITVRYAGMGDDTSTEADTTAFLRELALRIGDDGATYLRALIAANESSGATALADLATHVGVDKKKIESWNRNLGRSIKATVRELGFLRTEQEDGTAQLFDYEWDNDGNRWLYLVPRDFRPTLVKHLDQR